MTKTLTKAKPCLSPEDERVQLILGRIRNIYYNLDLAFKDLKEAQAAAKAARKKK